MKSRIVTPRNAFRADLPWTAELRAGLYELTDGKRKGGGYYSKSSWANACMNIRGTELANLPWKITRNDKVIEKHPLIDMLTKFGPESNYAEAIHATEIDLLLCGQAFWLRDVDILKRLNPTTIEVIKSKDGISEFKQTIEGEVVNRFPREEVVYFREYHPDDDLGAGVAVTEVAKTDIDVENEASKYIDAFFKNDATPSLLLTTEQTVSTPEMNKVLLWWNTKFRGYRNAHKVAMADRGLKAQILSKSLKENAIIGVRDQARGGICVAYRVPSILVGNMQEATYANAQEARKFMIEDVTLPRSVYYQDTINQDLVQHVDEGVKFEFASEELHILQEDTNLKWDRLSEAERQGIVTREFVASEMGWPEPEEKEPVPEQLEVSLTSEDETLRAWRRKANKSFKAGKGANVDFETDEIAESKQMAIRAKLSDSSALEDVKLAFV